LREKNVHLVSSFVPAFLRKTFFFDAARKILAGNNMHFCFQAFEIAFLSRNLKQGFKSLRK